MRETACDGTLISNVSIASIYKLYAAWHEHERRAGKDGMSSKVTASRLLIEDEQRGQLLGEAPNSGRWKPLRWGKRLCDRTLSTGVYEQRVE